MTPDVPVVAISDRKRVRIHHLVEAKKAGERMTMLTAYDSVTAKIFDDAGIDMLLVGDSIGDNMFGYENTIPVTIDEMIPAVRAVAKTARRALVVADLPFGTYEASPQQAHASAVRMLKEASAHVVKLEGGRRIAPQVELLTGSGIPAMGHLGFTPQSENMLGGKRIQGRGSESATRLKEDALALQDAGAIAIVLEMVPESVAAAVTEILRIPTIGIGAGNQCDAQVLVWMDMAGMGHWAPRFAKQFGQVGAALTDAAKAFAGEVRTGAYPAQEHTYFE